MTTALVDGDLIAYINAVSAKGAPERFAVSRAHNMLDRIIDESGCDQYRVFLSGGDNFRKQINPDYKSHRPPNPEHLLACQDMLRLNWGAETTDGYEADDALGINQTNDTIICSIDKDLLMIDGMHYSWEIVRKGKVSRPAMFRTVSPIEGIRHFYKQMLIGDVADNLVGIEHIGEVKASKMLDKFKTEEEMKNLVEQYYFDEVAAEQGYSRFYMNADCFWIWRDLGVTYSVREELREG